MGSEDLQGLKVKGEENGADSERNGGVSPASLFNRRIARLPG